MHACTNTYPRPPCRPPMSKCCTGARRSGPHPPPRPSDRTRSRSSFRSSSFARSSSSWFQAARFQMEPCNGVRMRVCERVCVCVRACVCVCMCVRACLHACVCANVCMCVCACVLACMCTCMRACVCVCAYVFLLCVSKGAAGARARALEGM